MRKSLGMFICAVLAGFCVGLGGCAYLAVYQTGRSLSAFLLAIGLFATNTLGLPLYTGRACYIPENPPSYLIDLAVIWLGNLFGTWVLSLAVRQTRLAETLTSVAEMLCRAKLGDGLLSLFLLGIMCNVFVFVSVESFENNRHEPGKYLAIVLGVMGFILSGMENTITDMFYLGVAGRLWTARGLLCLMAVTLGNACGGVIIPLGRKIMKWLDRV